MNLFRFSVFMVLKGFSFGSVDFFYDQYEPDESFEFILEPENRLNTPSNGENNHHDFINIENCGKVYLGDNVIIAQETANYIALDGSIGPIYPDQTGLVISHPDPDQKQPADNDNFNPCETDALESSSHNIIPNDRRSVVSNHPIHARYTHQGELLEGNDDGDFQPPTYHDSHDVLSPSMHSVLIRISDLSPELKGRIERDGFKTSKKLKLLHRSVSKKRLESVALTLSNSIVFSTFMKPGSAPVFGGSGGLGLYAHATQFAVSLFKMKPEFSPPSWLRSQDLSKLDKSKELFKDALWSVQIITSGKVVKSGSDPSEVITLWTITNKKVYKIDLNDQEISKILFLRKGDLVVALPTQLNHIMPIVKEGTTYRNFLTFIKSSIDLSLDQLIVVVEV